MFGSRETTRRTLASEEGFGLIEVLVSAVLMVVVSLAAFTALDSASRGSGRIKARAIAGSLAQQDQERLQQIGAPEVANIDQVRDVVQDGVTYKVSSSGQFIADTDQEPGCGNQRADYIRITTTVTWPVMGAIKPLRVVSNVRPPAGSYGPTQGSISLQVNNAAGVGLTGLSVGLTDGPGAAMARTTEKGCAFFAYVKVGSYKLRYSIAGWVDRNGTEEIVKDASAIGEQTTAYTGEYDRAGSIVADVFTRHKRTAAAAAGFASFTPSVRLAQSGIPGGGQRLLSPVAPATVDKRFTAAGLFPFPSAYAMHTGSCTGNILPTALATSARAAGYATDPLITPGGALGTPTPLKLFQPALEVRVRTGTSSYKTGAAVYVYPRGACPGARIARTTIANGYLADPGFPYGTYDVCAEWTTTGVTYRKTVTGANNAALNGTAVTLQVPTSGTIDKASCPAV